MSRKMKRQSVPLSSDALTAVKDWIKTDWNNEISVSKALCRLVVLGLERVGYVLRSNYASNGLLPQLIAEYGEGAELPPFIRLSKKSE